MATVTFTATTDAGTIVTRSSSTRDYNFVVLAKTCLDRECWNAQQASDGTEGPWGWSGDRVNAEKAAAQARKCYASVRVVAVEAKLTGKDAAAAKRAEKAAR